MRLIWEYNIEPFIEDQFFGHQDRIDYFRFEPAYARYLRQRDGAPSDQVDGVGDGERPA